MKRRRLLQQILLTVGVLSIIATMAVFIGYRRVTQDPEILLAQIQKQADMHLNNIRQTATKNGIREWRMEAESATLLKAKQTMLLIKPDVEFFMNDGDNVHLTSDNGKIYTNSNEISLSGNVAASTSRYQFSTESLKYNPATRQLLADEPVTLSGQAFILRANNMAMDLETNVTHFEGDVEGIISEDLQL